jgi:hypothetical protein
MRRRPTAARPRPRAVLGGEAHHLRLLQRERPDIAQLTAFNAEVNSHHMIGVNERRGFVPVERLGELQKKPA